MCKSLSIQLCELSLCKLCNRCKSFCVIDSHLSQRLSPNIDTNDLNTKVNNARKFIGKGNKVKITLRFRGREMAHVQQSKHILDDFAKQLADIATVEKQPKLEGRSMSMVLTEKR